MNNVYDKFGCCGSCGYVYCDVLDSCIRPWETECISHRQLNKLDEFNLTELGVFIAGVFASLSAFMVVLFRSKCETINCCCFKCKRNVQAIIDEERLQMTGHTGRSPKENENKPELKLELKEPENENKIN
jgi:hypothetical protein